MWPWGSVSDADPHSIGLLDPYGIWNADLHSRLFNFNKKLRIFSKIKARSFPLYYTKIRNFDNLLLIITKTLLLWGAGSGILIRIQLALWIRSRSTLWFLSWIWIRMKWMGIRKTAGIFIEKYPPPQKKGLLAFDTKKGMRHRKKRKMWKKKEEKGKSKLKGKGEKIKEKWMREE